MPLIENIPGATPIDDISGLIPTHITTHAELRDMFDETWDWAGKFRQSSLNIGANWHAIPEQIKLLVDDIDYWTKDKKVFNESIRIHHRLVKIHPFVNGNGRHARLAADIYLFDHNHRLPVWPDKELIRESAARKQYITALQSADKGNYDQLEKFTLELIK